VREAHDAPIDDPPVPDGPRDGSVSMSGGIRDRKWFS
jgi:hypothetical protein